MASTTAALEVGAIGIAASVSVTPRCPLLECVHGVGVLVIGRDDLVAPFQAIPADDDVQPFCRVPGERDFCRWTFYQPGDSGAH
jgi:hypothetical protein